MVVVDAPFESSVAVAVGFIGEFESVAAGDLAGEWEELPNASRRAVLPSSVVRLRWARVGVGSLGYDVVGVEVLEALEPDQLLEGGVDPAVGGCVRFALHVCREGGAVPPAADHDYLTGFAVRLPDLEVDEAVGIVHEVRTRAEGGDQLRRSALRDPQPR